MILYVTFKRGQAKPPLPRPDPAALKLEVFLRESGALKTQPRWPPGTARTTQYEGSCRCLIEYLAPLYTRYLTFNLRVYITDVCNSLSMQ